MDNTEILQLGISKLNDFQKSVFTECINKGSGGMSIPLGSGKTLTSIVLALEQTKELNRPILIVVSKTLIESWIFEIKKFFSDNLKYIIFHTDYIKNIHNYIIPEDVKLVITTPQILSKTYKDYDIMSEFVIIDIINEGMFNQHTIKRYKTPLSPFINIKIGLPYLFSIKWGSLIIDEVQKYTKIITLTCQALGAICSNHRWALSGTMFSEPSIERILGFYIIIDDDTFPRSLPHADKFIKSKYFKGFNTSIVSRKTNPCFVLPEINQCIISHKLSYEEEVIYISMKQTMQIISDQLKKFKFNRDVENMRKFGSYLLAIICYLRQCIISPILPIANIALDMSDFQNKSELYQILLTEIKKLNIDDWLNDENSVKSTRMAEALKIVDKHESDNIVIFMCFRTSLDIFKTFLKDDRKIYTISGTMSSIKRSETLEKFKKKSDNGKGNILLLTYEIGSEGLNLQISNTILLVDFFWNDGKTKQAIARILRYGQLSPVVNIYLFTSNTAIEKAMFEKHDLKLTILKELSEGTSKTKLKTMNVNEIIKIVNTEENINAIDKINSKY